MSEASDKRSAEFLAISGQFKLGALVTETSHPVTANLSEVAKADIANALDLLFQADADVVAKFREFAESGAAAPIAARVLKAVRDGGRIFFTGCGSTGRLSIQLVSIWRNFWRRTAGENGSEWENRAFSVMAGGDFALIKSVEGFEDFAEFGRKQIKDLGVSGGDVVFAITEGGETSFVIGTAWRGVEAGAKVYFVYNNPDPILREHVQRSREVIDDPRIEKINLTTGPMSITGSTRMQATTIQLTVMLTVMEMVVRELSGRGDPRPVATQFLEHLTGMHSTLRSREVRTQMAKLVSLEEEVYRAGRKNNYYADMFGIDVLTDTTERSPTYCTPPFRKYDDVSAAESWSYLFVPQASTARAWENILKREPNCVEWTDDEVRSLVPADKAARTIEIVRRIGTAELMRFRVGADGLPYRLLKPGDSAIGIVGEAESESLLSPSGFHHVQLENAIRARAHVGLVLVGSESWLRETEITARETLAPRATVRLQAPRTDFLLDGVTRAGVKMFLNALSTCTMVRLGRVLGNYMIWVVASNLKLIDRATRYIQKLTGKSYEESNRLLFEIVEYVEPRMKSDQAYPPVVGMAVMRARHGLTNEQAEQRLLDETR